MTIEVVNLSLCDNFFTHPYDVYCGESMFYHKKRIPISPYYNKWHRKRYKLTKTEQIEKFILYVVPRLDITPLVDIHKKYGIIRLGCWCSPASCHCDIIKSMIEGAERKGDSL